MRRRLSVLATTEMNGGKHQLDRCACSDYAPYGPTLRDALSAAHVAHIALVVMSETRAIDGKTLCECRIPDRRRCCAHPRQGGKTLDNELKHGTNSQPGLLDVLFPVAALESAPV